VPLILHERADFDTELQDMRDAAAIFGYTIQGYRAAEEIEQWAKSHDLYWDKQYDRGYVVFVREKEE